MKPKQQLLCGLMLAFLLLGANSMAQQKFTINGYVKDQTNGEELIGVTVYVNELKTGAITNVYGFYALNLAPGSYTITYSFVGYKNVIKTIEVTKDETFNVEMPVDVLTIDEVVVTSEPLDANVTDIKMSRNEINVKQVKKLPALFGEPDIIKTIQMLPGVLTAGEGTSSFFVRGGSADQNLILIDEAPIYDPSHLFGLFSVFNADVIKDSELYKGGIPSRYGGRLSSILDVRTKDGNNKKFGGSAGVGTLASKIMLEGPIKKEKSSYIVSARRSYVDLFLKAAGEDNTVFFYDVNAKVNFKGNNNDRFFAAVYLGRDKFNFGDDFGFGWGNATATFRWNHLFSDRLFSNTTVIASRFDYSLEAIDDTQGFTWDSDINEISLKEDLNYFIDPSNTLDFGYHVTYRKFSPGEIKPENSSSIFSGVTLPEEYAIDHGLYIDHEVRLNPKLSMRYGTRLSMFQSVGKSDVILYEDPQDNIDIERIDTLSFDRLETIKNYINIEPRFSLRYLINQGSSLKFSYNRMAQNTHLISSGTVPIPFNTWAPSSYYLKPQLADQVALGYFKNFKNNKYEFSVESYYKDMNNVTDFADNAQLFFNQDLSTEYRQGDSWSYGLEFMLQKKEGDFTGFASYTWSKTERKVPGVNRDQPFLANYDRRHALNVIGTYDVNERWSLGANFTYTTGRPITLPAGKYQYDGYLIDMITERNSFQLPDYHRLDLSATWNSPNKKQRKWDASWVFSIYNAYSRKNPFTIYTRTLQDDEGNILGDGTEKEARLIYLFPILPSITCNVKF